MNPLESRKQLLIAKSELNRERMLEEWQAMTEGIGRVADRVKLVGALAAAAGLLVAGVSAFRGRQAMRSGGKSSWFHRLLKGARLAGPFWLAIRARF